LVVRFQQPAIAPGSDGFAAVEPTAEAVKDVLTARSEPLKELDGRSRLSIAIERPACERN
jgi:hypothetical protein